MRTSPRTWSFLSIVAALLVAGCGGKWQANETDAGSPGGGRTGGSGGRSGTTGTGGRGPGDAATNPDADSVACPNGSVPTHVVDTLADALTASSTHLYWLDSKQAVMRQSKATGASEKLTSTGGRGIRIRVDATRVFWEEMDDNRYKSLYSMPLDKSAAPTRLAAGVAGWAVGGDRVFYWSAGAIFDGGGHIGEIDSVLETGGSPTVVVPDARADGPMAADDSGVYWFDDRAADAGAGFLKFTFASEAQDDFHRSTMIRHLLAADHRVLWADEDGYLGPADIRWSLPAGANVVTIASGQHDILGLAADATTAYWLTAGPLAALGPADLAAAPLAGGPIRKLACDIDMPLGLAVDDDAVYVSTLVGVVLRVSK